MTVPELSLCPLSHRQLGAQEAELHPQVEMDRYCIYQVLWGHHCFPPGHPSGWGLEDRGQGMGSQRDSVPPGAGLEMRATGGSFGEKTVGCRRASPLGGMAV